MPPKLAIIAGDGSLPVRLVAECRRQGREFFVVTFLGTNEIYEDIGPNVHRLAIGSIGKLLKLLHSESCKDVILAGNFRRPSLKPVGRLDWRGSKLFSRIIRAGGDDNVLRLVIEEFEKDGFRVVGIDEVFPALLSQAGVLGAIKPNDQFLKDIELGLSLLNTLAPFDIGQAVAIESQRILGIEGPEGTEELIERCAILSDPTLAPILVKSQKLGQDRRADLPAVGPDTVVQLHAAGFAGMALEASAVVLIDKDRILQRADAAGIFVIGVPSGASTLQ